MKTAAWHLVLWGPVVLAAFTNAEEGWIQNVRKLQAGQFMQVCNQVFMRDMPHKSYLMSNFANDVGSFCSQFTTKKSSCPNGGFSNLQVDFQDAFFRHASQHTGSVMRRFPFGALTRLGDTGYIVSDRTVVELDVMKNDLCVQMQTAFGDSMQMPKQFEDPASDPFATPNPTSNPTAAPTSMPTTAARTVRPTNSPGTDLGNQDNFSQQQNDLNPNEHQNRPVQMQQEDTTLSVGAIVGIAVAVAALLFCFFYFEARRRSLARQVGILAATTNNSKNNGSGKGKSTSGIDSAKTQPTKSLSSKLSRKPSAKPTRASKPASAALEEIQDAIDNADWDNIYRLASVLAEEDEAQTLPGLDVPKGSKRRSHLNAEDQERTKTLDDLMSKGDWTGLAVTAALYAGESGSSHQHAASQATSSKKTRKSLHQDDDWEKTHVVSLDDHSHSSSPSSLSGASFDGRDIEQGHASVDGLVRNLNAALNAGDWSQVNQLATKIKEQKGASGGSSFASDVPDSQAMVLASGSSRIGSQVSTETHDTEMSRKQTIEKLMRAEKWKGVSIMANLYEMESRQTNSAVIKATSSGARSSGRPPRTRKSGRTKELRHSDRVDENIVGFREDDAIVPYGRR